MTAQFTGLHEGSTVSFTQHVAGTVSGLPTDTDAWLVVQPTLTPGAYWPQPGPLHPDVNGDFSSLAYFGESATQNSGEEFTLMIVGAPPDASQRFRDFISNQQGKGMPGLPGCTQTWTQITVKRS